MYAVEGEGYTEDAGQSREVGSRSDVLYVLPPAMWEHQHMNDNPNPIKQLRIAFGIRQWFTSVWPEGFTSQRIYDKSGKPIEAEARFSANANGGSGTPGDVTHVLRVRRCEPLHVAQAFDAVVLGGFFVAV